MKIVQGSLVFALAPTGMNRGYSYRGKVCHTGFRYFIPLLNAPHGRIGD
jgi:hypothetical protein